MSQSALAAATVRAIALRQVATSRGIRVLAWDGNVLYASRGYELVRWNAPSQKAGRTSDRHWQAFASFHPAWWRTLTSRSRLSSRIVRDGFHSLAVVHGPSNESRDEIDDRTSIDRTFIDPTCIGAVPGAIVTRAAGSDEFRVTHKVRRGTRPLHITATPRGTVYWGEYFDNRERAEVHIYASEDRGETWHVAHTFPAGAIRHVHNIVHDPWGDCLWILTGDEGAECRVLRADCELRRVEVVLSGSQQARAVAAIPMPDALYLSTDTPLEANHVLRLARAGSVEVIAGLASSSIFACGVGEAVFFSTMVEPSAVNRSREVQIVGSADQENWQALARWQKDKWPMHYFQYGNAILPDGVNTTRFLAATTVAVVGDDSVTTLWEVE